MTYKILKIVCFLSLFTIIFSCKDSEGYAPVKTSKSVADYHEKHVVKVLESQGTGTYTYAKVSENNDEFWIAIPQTAIKVGETYSYIGGSKMVDFKSKELDKTFETIFFVDKLLDENPSKSAENTVSKNYELIPQPEGGIAVNKILENPKNYNNQSVTVKGKVVKVNMEILDRNWIHITDGTEFEQKYTLTFTSKDKVNVGDIVTLTGKVTLDKDFGYGYVYPILVEESKVIN